VIGYVHTKTGYPNINGYRNFSDVSADIAYWNTTFSIDGIFVDEVTNNWPDSSYDSFTIAKSFYGEVITYI
jgi:hypothetical protein